MKFSETELVAIIYALKNAGAPEYLINKFQRELDKALEIRFLIYVF